MQWNFPIRGKYRAANRIIFAYGRTTEISL